MTAPQDRKVVIFVPAHEGESRRLSVKEIMENDGAICGPEWGWITLGEIVTHGFGLDTDAERWELLGEENKDLVAGMRAYWKAHPEMANGEYTPPAL